MQKDLLIKNYRAYLILTVVVILGSYYRFLGIGSPDLWVDEYYHVIASKSILKGVGPLLPSGLNYSRSILYTLMVSVSQVIFGANNFAFRFPSAVFGIMLILASYFFLRKCCCEKAGLIVAFLIAFDSLSFTWSRICRMYSMFEFFFFVSAVLLFWLLSDLSFNKKSIKLWIVFILTFGITVSLQPLGLILPISACTYLFIAFLVKLNKKNSLILFILSGAILIATFIVLFMVDYLIPSDYFLLLFKQINPLFLLFTSLAFGYSLLKRKNFGVFAGSIFFTALAIHSYFFSDWQKSRYIIYAVPFAYVLMAIPVANFLNHVFKNKEKIIKNVAVAIISILIIFSSKLLINNIYNVKLEVFPNYKKAVEALNKGIGSNKDVVIVSTLPAVTTYYFGKTDYWLRSWDFQRYIFVKNGKTREIYSGAVLLKNAKELKNITSYNNNVWIFADHRLNEYGDLSIKRMISKYFEPVYVDKTVQIKVFRKKQ